MTSSSAGLLALKAELQRAEEQARTRSAGSSFSGSSHKKLTLKNDGKVNRQVGISSQRATAPSKSKPNEETVEDARITESRRKLEQKARMYEELQCKARESIAKNDSDDESSSQLANPSNEHPLVDFEQKVLLDFAYEREKERRSATSNSKPTGVDKALRNPKFDSITDADASQRDRLQEKWKREAEQNDLKLETDGNLHYQDIRFDEIREHGTSYFQFARDTATRASQQADLRTMHAETESNRRKRDLVKLEREQALRARLAAVKRLRLGRSVEATQRERGTDNANDMTEHEDDDDDDDETDESSSDAVGDESKDT